MMKMTLVLAVFLCFLNLANAQSIDTHCAQVSTPPNWMKMRAVEKVCDHVENLLEWPIKKVQVFWYPDQIAFQKIHGYGSAVRAFARKSDNTIHLGPQANAENLSEILGHELTHVILYQKYKSAIPKWLEEGLANYVGGKKNAVDYPWLAKQSHPKVETMGHPFKSVGSPKYHYMASTALIEMIAKKCDLHDLLQLSVGSKLETFIRQTCEISDLNAEFKKWVGKKAAPLNS